MKNKTHIIILLILTLVLSSPISFAINAENSNSLMNWIVNTRKDEINEELSSVSNLLINEGYGDTETLDIDENNLITAYFIDTSKVVEENDKNGNFKNLITNKYFYRYFDPERKTVTEIIKDSSTGNWIIGETSLEIEGYIEKFPELSYIPTDITTNLLNLYPTLDYSSVKFIYLMEVSQTLVYFTCGDESYVAYYPLVEIDNGLKAGEIYTANKMLAVLSEYPIYNPVTGGDIRGSITAEKSHNFPWYAYAGIGIGAVVAAGTVVYVIKKKKSNI